MPERTREKRRREEREERDGRAYSQTFTAPSLLKLSKESKADACMSSSTQDNTHIRAEPRRRVHCRVSLRPLDFMKNGFFFYSFVFQKLLKLGSKRKEKKINNEIEEGIFVNSLLITML